MLLRGPPGSPRGWLAMRRGVVCLSAAIRARLPEGSHLRARAGSGAAAGSVAGVFHSLCPPAGPRGVGCSLRVSRRCPLLAAERLRRAFHRDRLPADVGAERTQAPAAEPAALVSAGPDMAPATLPASFHTPKALAPAVSFADFRERGDGLQGVQVWELASEVRDYVVECVLRDLQPIHSVAREGQRRFLAKYAQAVPSRRTLSFWRHGGAGPATSQAIVPQNVELRLFPHESLSRTHAAQGQQLAKSLATVRQDIGREVAALVGQAKAAQARFALQGDTWKPATHKGVRLGSHSQSVRLSIASTHFACATQLCRQPR